jgi:pyridoxamine 5'-phosphate oxidase
MSDYIQIRKAYSGQPLDFTETPDPIRLLDQWLADALTAGIPEPNAMCLSTVDSLGQPSSRMVLLRDLSDKGLIFYTNYTSRKAIELADNPQVALLFYWTDLDRQIRIEGHVELVTAEVSDAYFQSRPRDHQIGAWGSPQSASIPDRKAIEDNVQRFDKMFEGKDVPRPSFWGGYVVIPHQIEFWQGRESRLHDRYRFVKNDGGWKMERLAP